MSVNLKENYCIISKINKHKCSNKDILKNLIKVIFKIIYIHNCPFTRLRLQYKILIFFNKIDVNFMIYIYCNRYYNDSKYLSENYNLDNNLDQKYHNIRYCDIKLTLENYFDNIKKPYKYNRKIINDEIDLIVNQSQHHIDNFEKFVIKIFEKYNINMDCIDIIISFIV